MTDLFCRPVWPKPIVKSSENPFVLSLQRVFYYRSKGIAMQYSPNIQVWTMLWTCKPLWRWWVGIKASFHRDLCLKFNMGVSNSTAYKHLHDLIWKWVLRANIYVLSFSLSNIPRIHTNTYSIYHILIIMHAVNKTNLHWPSNNTKVMWIHLWKHDLYIFWRKQQD